MEAGCEMRLKFLDRKAAEGHMSETGSSSMEIE